MSYMGTSLPRTLRNTGSPSSSRAWKSDSLATNWHSSITHPWTLMTYLSPDCYYGIIADALQFHRRSERVNLGVGVLVALVPGVGIDGRVDVGDIKKATIVCTHCDCGRVPGTRLGEIDACQYHGFNYMAVARLRTDPVTFCLKSRCRPIRHHRE